MEKKLNDSYWESRYQKGETGWDIGEISTPLMEFFNSIDNKNLKILIPGCGNAYEAAYLHSNGFKNVFLLDFAESPLIHFQKNNPDFPKQHLIHQDFFTESWSPAKPEIHDGVDSVLTSAPPAGSPGRNSLCPAAGNGSIRITATSS